MEPRISNRTARVMALVGAVAWLLMAVSWQVSDSLERTRGWDGLPQAMFMVGLICLLIGGLALGVMAVDPSGPVPRPRARIGGLVLLTFALVVSFVAGWAVPVWTAAYGLAMLAHAWSGVLRAEGWIIGGALAAASVSWFTLSALEVGAVDSYGDYPVAWTTASWIAAIGSALGLALWSRSLRAGSTERAPVAAVR